MQAIVLDQEEFEIARQCLRAAVEGPFFPEWEFQTLIGWTRKEVQMLTQAWSSPSETSEELVDVIIAVLNNLVGYPHGQEVRWSEFIAVPKTEVTRLLDTIVDRRGHDQVPNG